MWEAILFINEEMLDFGCEEMDANPTLDSSGNLWRKIELAS